jgi:hypothetical protein
MLIHIYIHTYTQQNIYICTNMPPVIFRKYIMQARRVHTHGANIRPPNIPHPQMMASHVPNSFPSSATSEILVTKCIPVTKSHKSFLKDKVHLANIMLSIHLFMYIYKYTYLDITVPVKYIYLYTHSYIYIQMPNIQNASINTYINTYKAFQDGSRTSRFSSIHTYHIVYISIHI